MKKGSQRLQSLVVHRVKVAEITAEKAALEPVKEEEITKEPVDIKG
jgi:hypothetical protein